MFNISDIPSSYEEDYKTLHHDIGLVQRSNGLWDLWFGQDEISKYYKNADHLNIVEGDLVSATEIHSLQVGIIVACLTSWNYLNRTGNPVYSEFGNESYSLLKRNKGVNTQYKIKRFFMDCLNRMRRVYSVEYLEVLEVESNPYLYKVVFKVLSITNTIADGEFYLSTDSNKNLCSLDVSYNHPYTSVSNPLFVECVLKNEYGSFIQGEVLYVYVKSDSDSKFKFYGITEATDEYGRAYITIPPRGLSFNTQVMFIFKGNSLYNSCYSKIINIVSVEYYIKSRYTYKPLLDDKGNVVKDDNGEEIPVIDKHILYVEDSNGNTINRDDKFRLGELLSDYVNINNISLSENISISTIRENLKSKDNPLEYDAVDKGEERKIYLVPSSKTIQGTNKHYYSGYCWNGKNKMVLVFDKNIQLNTTHPNEVHFLINDSDNGLFEISFGDGHLYYQIELLDNEF